MDSHEYHTHTAILRVRPILLSYVGMVGTVLWTPMSTTHTPLSYVSVLSVTEVTVEPRVDSGDTDYICDSGEKGYGSDSGDKGYRSDSGAKG